MWKICNQNLFLQIVPKISRWFLLTESVKEILLWDPVIHLSHWGLSCMWCCPWLASPEWRIWQVQSEQRDPGGCYSSRWRWAQAVSWRGEVGGLGGWHGFTQYLREAGGPVGGGGHTAGSMIWECVWESLVLIKSTSDREVGALEIIEHFSMSCLKPNYIKKYHFRWNQYTLCRHCTWSLDFGFSIWMYQFKDNLI